MNAEVIVEVKSNGQIHERMVGLHGKEFIDRLENEGVITVANRKALPEGALQADITWGKQRKTANGIFPAAWDLDMIREKTQEALQNLTKKPSFAKDGSWVFFGKTRRGLELKIIIRSDGSIIVFPKTIKGR